MLNILNMSSSHAIKDRENTYMHVTDDVMSGRSGGQPDRSTILRWGGTYHRLYPVQNSCNRVEVSTVDKDCTRSLHREGGWSSAFH
jgi:hypothetical protein